MMTADRKIDEVLKVVREQGERQDRRLDDVLKIIHEQNERNDLRFARLEAKDDELLKRMTEQRELILEDRALNTKRFSQMEGSIGQLRLEVGKMNVGLNEKIDLLSVDMQGLSEELYETKQRFGRSGKKLPS